MKQKILTISATVGVGVMVVAAVLPALFPAQEVYAPSSRRGLLCGDMSPMGSLAYPMLSPASICPCDDMDVLNAAYEKYMAGVYT